MGMRMRIRQLINEPIKRLRAQQERHKSAKTGQLGAQICARLSLEGAWSGAGLLLARLTGFGASLATKSDGQRGAGSATGPDSSLSLTGNWPLSSGECFLGCCRLV